MYKVKNFNIHLIFQQRSFFLIIFYVVRLFFLSQSEFMIIIYLYMSIVLIIDYDKKIKN